MSLSTLVFCGLLGAVVAQIPSLGWCPDYQPMADFDVKRFLGMWHEQERYFSVSELGSRCVATNYELKPDGRIWVSNLITNTFTGIKRILDGQLQLTGKVGEGKMSVRYSSLPVPIDTAYSVLETDYDSFAVVWACNGIGPIHTQNAWLMTRQRNPAGPILQRAYGVLDKYKISRTFFMKTNQDDCVVLAPAVEAIDPVTQAPVTLPPAPEIAAKETGSLEATVPIPAPSQEIPAEPILSEQVNHEAVKPKPVAEVLLAAAQVPAETPVEKLEENAARR